MEVTLQTQCTFAFSEVLNEREWPNNIAICTIQAVLVTFTQASQLAGFT